MKNGTKLQQFKDWLKDIVNNMAKMFVLGAYLVMVFFLTAMVCMPLIGITAKYMLAWFLYWFNYKF